jgi:hypothetical protein
VPVLRVEYSLHPTLPRCGRGRTPARRKGSRAAAWLERSLAQRYLPLTLMNDCRRHGAIPYLVSAGATYVHTEYKESVSSFKHCKNLKHHHGKIPPVLESQPTGRGLERGSAAALRRLPPTESPDLAWRVTSRLPGLASHTFAAHCLRRIAGQRHHPSRPIPAPSPKPCAESWHRLA